MHWLHCPIPFHYCLLLRMQSARHQVVCLFADAPAYLASGSLNQMFCNCLELTKPSASPLLRKRPQ